MPEVPGAPFQPVFTAQPTERPIPLREVNVPPGAFGANIAHALTLFGGDTERAGNELITRADALAGLRNETNARETAIKATQEMAQAQQRFDALEGKNADDAYPGHLKDLDAIRTKYRASLDNPMAQKLFDAEAASLQNSFTRASAARAGAQLKEYQIGTSNAKIAQLKGTVVDPFDVDALEDKNEDIKEEYAAQQPLRGWSDVERDEKAQEAVSGSFKEFIKSQALRNPWSAQKYLDEHRSEFRQNDYREASDYVLQQTHEVGSRLISEVVNRNNSVAGVPGSFVDRIKTTLEGFDPKAKWDVKQWTVGYGTRAKFPGEMLSRTEADQRFNEEFTKVVSAVDRVNPNLTEGTRAALASLTYNTGTAWINQSLGAAIRAGDEEKAKGLFVQYNQVAGAFNQTIQNRRNQEVSWFGKNEVTDKGMQARVDEARALAKELSPNDPIMWDRAGDAAQRDYQKIKAGEADADWNNRQSVVNAIITRNQDGKLPISEAEIKTDPQVAEAWSHLKPTDRAAMLRALHSNLGADRVVMNDERLQRLQFLYGLAKEHPGQFLDINPVTEDLPMREKEGLVKLWVNTRTKQEDDPHLNHAMELANNTYGTFMNDLKKNDENGYIRFKGALYQAILAYRGRYNEPPKSSDLQDIVGMTIKATIPGAVWGTWKAYDPPSSALEHIREMNPGFNEDEVLRKYHRTQAEILLEQLEQFKSENKSVGKSQRYSPTGPT